MINKIIISQLEKDIALILIQKAAIQEIDEKTTAEIAGKVLQILPVNLSTDDFEKVLIKIKESYSGFSQLVIKYLDLSHNEKDSKQLNKIRGKINHILYGSSISG